MTLPSPHGNREHYEADRGALGVSTFCKNSVKEKTEYAKRALTAASSLGCVPAAFSPPSKISGLPCSASARVLHIIDPISPGASTWKCNFQYFCVLHHCFLIAFPWRQILIHYTLNWRTCDVLYVVCAWQE